MALVFQAWSIAVRHSAQAEDIASSLWLPFFSRFLRWEWPISARERGALIASCCASHSLGAGRPWPRCQCDDVGLTAHTKGSAGVSILAPACHHLFPPVVVLSDIPPIVGDTLRCRGGVAGLAAVGGQPHGLRPLTRADTAPAAEAGVWDRRCRQREPAAFSTQRGCGCAYDRSNPRSHTQASHIANELEKASLCGHRTH